MFNQLYITNKTERFSLKVDMPSSSEAKESGLQCCSNNFSVKQLSTTIKTFITKAQSIKPININAYGLLCGPSS